MTNQSQNVDGRRRGRFDVAVESNERICREHYRLRLRIGAGQMFPATRAGHFVQLGCRPPETPESDTGIFGNELEWEPGCRMTVSQPDLLGRMAVLRKPFSLSGRGDDERGAWLEVIHRVVGVGTAWLAERKAGDAMDLIGPLGNVFELPAGKSMGLLVGGGVGLPPMFYLAEALAEARWRAIGFVGALSRDLLAVTLDPKKAVDATGRPATSVVEFARHGFDSVVTTDDGSMGLKGRITAGLEKVLATLSDADAAKTVIYTCGPEPMMHAVAEMAGRRGIACQVCLEQAMACGMGTCQSCVVKIEDADRPQARTENGRGWRYRLACTDGPVFASNKVIW